VRDGIALVTIDRPERLNTLHPAAHAELEAVWPHLAEDDDVGAVVLTGAGACFSAGGDVKDMLEQVRERPEAGPGISTAQARRLVYGMLDLDKPLITAVEGRAFGLGATVALLADLVVAAETARFSDPHVNVGLVPGDGGAAIWTLLVGPHRAKEILWWGQVLDAPDAARLGLVNRVVPDGDAVDTALALAADLLRQPALAVRGTKTAINAWVKGQLASIFEASLALEQVTMTSADFVEALNALADKRRPVFGAHARG
jgi:enoyl-CoA hydratase/carnithine racemase